MLTDGETCTLQKAKMCTQASFQMGMVVGKEGKYHPFTKDIGFFGYAIPLQVHGFAQCQSEITTMVKLQYS